MRKLTPEDKAAQFFKTHAPTMLKAFDGREGRLVLKLMVIYAAREVAENDREIERLEMILQNKLPIPGEGDILAASDAYHEIADIIGTPAIEKVEVLVQSLEEKNKQLERAKELLGEQISWANNGMIDAFRGHDYRAMWEIWGKFTNNLRAGFTELNKSK